MKANTCLLLGLTGLILSPLHGVFAASYADAVQADGPIAYYRFGDIPPVATNSGSLGAAANGFYTNDATAGAEAPRPPGFPGFEADNTALQLDGAGDFVGTVSGLLNDKPAFTISGWIRRSGAQANRTGLFGQNDKVEFGYIDNNTIQAWTDNGLNVTPNPFPDGTWSYLALVSEGSPGIIRMYTNGLLAASRSHALPANGAFGFNIGGGGIFDVTGNFFNGQIDEVAVFDKALTADQIAAHYFSGAPSPPIITRQPQSTNVFEGADVILSVAVVGTAPFAYQWSFFGGEISGQTNSTLVFTNIATDASGIYSVQITNVYGVVVSAEAEINVMPTAPPVITQEPASITRYAGATGVLTVGATGGSRLQYQWQKAEVNVVGATNASLILSNLQTSDMGEYQVIVANAAGSVTSMLATVTVILPAPGSYEELIVSCQPVAYWRFNETNGTTAVDYYGGKDATYVNTAAPGPEAPRPSAFPGFEAGNTAVQLDGTSGYVTGPVGLMNTLPAFTMAGWIRRATDQADRTGLFGQNDIVEFGYINNTTLELWTDNGLDIAPASFPNEEWSHIAVVSDGSPGTASMYTNGLLAGSREHFLPPGNSFPFNIGGGGIFDTTGNFFNGQIDEVAVFGQALSAEKICALYLRATGKPVVLSIARMGNIVRDSKPSGTPHHGASLGAEWAADNTAGTVTRNGVMQFVATEGDQIVLPSHPDFDSSRGTIMFWMRSAGTAGTGNDGAILFDRRPAAPGGPPGDVIAQFDAGNLFVQAASGTGLANSFQTVRTLNDDLWHHITYVYDQSATGSISIYIDGTLDTSQTNTLAWSWTPSQRIELGRSHDPYWRAYNGAMDDFRIYDRILTAGEIMQVASSDDLVDGAALKVRFNFNDAPDGLSLRWLCGTLQCTDTLVGNGPGTTWTDVPGAASPYVVDPLTAPHRFYRVKY